MQTVTIGNFNLCPSLFTLSSETGNRQVGRHTPGFESPATTSVKIKSSKVVLDRATNEDNINPLTGQSYE
nr:MAG TPA: hypothetical protein [Caudoviricetes sp.]